MERIRAGLAQPPSLLQVPPPSSDSPTFRLEIQAQPFTMQPIELVMDGIEHIRSAAVDYKHRRADRRAAKEVDGALATFCAVRECPK
jgi:hypothetical protein